MNRIISEISNVGWNFDNSYARLPEKMLSRLAPDQVRKPKLITLYHLTQGYLPNQQPLYINIVISLILAASFFYYSRKTE